MSFLGIALGIISFGFMLGAGNLDTILVDLTALSNPAITLVQLGFFALGLYCITEI